MPRKVVSYSGNRRYKSLWNESDSLYVYARTTIELLKQLTINVDDTLAWQYGQVYDAPWKDCHHTAKQFADYYPGVLYMYLINKCITSLKDISEIVTYSLAYLDKASIFKLADTGNKDITKKKDNDSEIRRLPISAAVADQIDVILKTGKVCKNATKSFGKYINQTFQGNLKLVCSQITDLDNMLLLTYNHIADEALITSGEDNYLRDDQIRDLLDIVNSMMTNPYLTVFNIAQRDVYLDTIRTCTYILSVLCNTFTVNSIIPERNEDMYKEVIESNSNYKSSIGHLVPFVRQFTNHSLEFVLRMPLNLTCSCYCPNHPETRNAVYPYSLQERYLNLWAMTNLLASTSEENKD